MLFASATPTDRGSASSVGFNSSTPGASDGRRTPTGEHAMWPWRSMDQGRESSSCESRTTSTKQRGQFERVIYPPSSRTSLDLVAHLHSRHGPELQRVVFSCSSFYRSLCSLFATASASAKTRRKFSSANFLRSASDQPRLSSSANSSVNVETSSSPWTTSVIPSKSLPIPT